MIDQTKNDNLDPKRLIPAIVVTFGIVMFVVSLGGMHSFFLIFCFAYGILRGLLKKPTELEMAEWRRYTPARRRNPGYIGISTRILGVRVSTWRRL